MDKGPVKSSEGKFIDQSSVGGTFYDASAASRGILRRLKIKEVGYTHTHIVYEDGEEVSYSSANRGEGTNIWFVLSFDEAKTRALNFLQTQQENNDDEHTRMAEELKARIECISNAVHNEMPRDSYEVAMESYEAGLATLGKRIETWREMIEELGIGRVIEKAKQKMIDALRKDAAHHMQSPLYEVEKGVEELTGVDLGSSGTDERIKAVFGAKTKDVRIGANDFVYILGKDIGKIDGYTILSENERKALRILSLLESFKPENMNRLVVPQAVESGMGMTPKEWKEWEETDVETIKGFFNRIDEVNELFSLFKNLNISERGTTSPKYLKVVE